MRVITDMNRPARLRARRAALRWSQTSYQFNQGLIDPYQFAQCCIAKAERANSVVAFLRLHALAEWVMENL